MQSCPLPPLRQGHLVRLRHARRCRDGERPPGTAVHLPLTETTRAPENAVHARPGASVDLTGRPRSTDIRAAWPARRLVAVAVATPLLLGLLVVTSGGWGPAASAGWITLVSLTALAIATTVATYLPLPGTGLRIDVGCTPCALVAPLTAAVSVGLLSSATHDVPSAMLALGVAAFGVVQRLKSASSCAA